MKDIHTNTKAKILITYCPTLLLAFFLFGCQNTSPIPPAFGADIPVKQLTDQAIEIVQAGLTDEDPRIRTDAAEVVAASRQVKLMPRVRHLLKDTSIPVRFAAAVAIGDFQYSLGKNDIKPLLNDSDENVRIAAVYALNKLGASNNLEIIRKAILSNDQAVRANAAWLLGKSGSANDLKLLYWALQNKDSGDKVRFVAVEAIAMLHDERIYPKIWTMLLSAYHDVKVTGIKAMGALGTQNAREAMMTMLDDSVVEIRLAAAEQLGALGDKTGEPEVLDVFRKNLIAAAGQEGAERIKFRTALAIGRICSPGLTRFLPEFIKDDSKSVRLAAAQAVLQCADVKK